MTSGRFSLLLGMVLVSLGLNGCGGGSSSATPSSSSGALKKWTYMVYMAGDNNLSDAALFNIHQMQQVGSSATVNVVAMAEFSPIYSTTHVPANTQRGLVIKGNNTINITSLADMGVNKDMGSAQTLTDFITWSKKTYPAENYALVLWSHGDGWKSTALAGGLTRGALQDDTSGSYMSMPDIVTAIKNAGGVTVLDFDACLMGMYEVAYQLRDTAKILVASAQLEPGDGNPYNAILAKLEANPAMSGLDLGKATVDAYVAYYNNYSSAAPKSVIDITKIGPLHSAMTQLSGHLLNVLSNKQAAIRQAQMQTIEYSEPGNRDLLDLLNKLKLSVGDATVLADADVAIAALKASTSTKVNNFPTRATAAINWTQAGGLAVYFPTETMATATSPAINETSSTDMQNYLALDVANGGATSWPAFVEQTLAGNNLLPMTNTGGFSYRLTWDDPKADLDLWIAEPNDTHASYEGTNSANGKFGVDSAISKNSEEDYTAKKVIAKGPYRVFANYYTYTGTCPSTGCPVIHAKLEYADPLKNTPQFTLVSQFTLSLSNPGPDSTTADMVALLTAVANAPVTTPIYSDWYFYPQIQTRSALLSMPIVAGTSDSYVKGKRRLQ